MSVLVHDGTMDGLLTAVAEAADAADGAVEVRAAHDWAPTLFDSPARSVADPERVQRLLEEMRARGSRRTVGRILYAAMSDRGDTGTPLAGYVRQVRRLGPRADDFLADPSVSRVQEAARAVGREVHRLKGLVRFRQLRDGPLWAPISPEAEIVSPLALYFRGRLPSDAWVLHDVRRCHAIRWDRHVLAWVEPGDLPPENPELSDCEAAYQALWQTYFRSIAVRERRNPRLQRQNMPVRYWKHLIEVPSPR